MTSISALQSSSLIHVLLVVYRNFYAQKTEPQANGGIICAQWLPLGVFPVKWQRIILHSYRRSTAYGWVFAFFGRLRWEFATSGRIGADGFCGVVDIVSDHHRIVWHILENPSARWAKIDVVEIVCPWCRCGGVKWMENGVLVAFASKFVKWNRILI